MCIQYCKTTEVLNSGWGRISDSQPTRPFFFSADDRGSNLAAIRELYRPVDGANVGFYITQDRVGVAFRSLT